MKRHWLRGIVLGVSLALLLAGGVALAQGLYATRDKACVQCWPLERQEPSALPPTVPEEYLVTLTYGGWIQNQAYSVCYRYVPPNMPAYYWLCLPTPLSDPQTMPPWYIPCGGILLPEGVDPSVVMDPYGRWAFEVEQRNNGTVLDSAHVSWLVAEVCEVEFVPEPGTMMLLGSGLVGLAGYATLRLRSGQAPRWRTRE